MVRLRRSLIVLLALTGWGASSVACQSSSDVVGSGGDSMGGGLSTGGLPVGSGGADGSGGGRSGGADSGLGGTLSGAGGSSSSGGQRSLGGSASGGSLGAGGEPQTGGAGSYEGVVLQGVRFVGRVDAGDAQRPKFSWSGTGFLARFEGTGLSVRLDNDSAFFFLTVVDESAPVRVKVETGEKQLTLAENLPSGEHVVSFYRETEGQYGVSELLGVEVTGGQLLEPPLLPGRFIEIVGDSISCGYGNLGPDRSCPFSYDTESHYETYGVFAAQALSAELSTIAISGHGVIRNYDGGTSDLMPTSYERTLTMVPSGIYEFGRGPDVVVVNLGTNDFAQGDPGLAFEDEYFRFLADLRDRHPDAYLLATLGPMLDGEKLVQARVYIESALDSMVDLGDDNVGFLEFSKQLESELGCDWHPNTTKHEAMGEVLSAKLREKLGW